MEITRSVSRFSVMAMLSLSVLSALGLASLCARGRTGSAVAAIGILLLTFEYLPAPYPVSPPDTPAWYEVLAADPAQGAVLNLPMSWDRPGYLLYQTVHRKPLTVAYISREDPRTLVDRMPVLQHFRLLGPDVIDFDLASGGLQVLSDLGVGWVVLDRYKMPSGDERAYSEAAASEIFAGMAPLFQDERLTVYEVGHPAAKDTYLSLGTGWEPFEPDSATRAFFGSAPIVIHSAKPVSGTLRVTLADGSAGLDAPGTGDVYRIPLSVEEGQSELVLRTLDPSGRALVSELAWEP